MDEVDVDDQQKARAPVCLAAAQTPGGAKYETLPCTSTSKPQLLNVHPATSSHYSLNIIPLRSPNGNCAARNRSSQIFQGERCCVAHDVFGWFSANPATLHLLGVGNSFEWDKATV